MADVIDNNKKNNDEFGSKWNPHAYHRNLPWHCVDPKDGIPFITKYAERKARSFLKLIRSIELTEEAFLDPKDVDIIMADNSKDQQQEEAETAMEEEGDVEDGEEEGLDFMDDEKTVTLASIIGRCYRLNSLWMILSQVKHNGLSQDELCEVFLRILRLLSATVHIIQTPNSSSSSSNNNGHCTVSLSFDDVGYYDFKDPNPNADSTALLPTSADLENSLDMPFALPIPTRDALFNIATGILAKKGPLLSVSNMAIFTQQQQQPSQNKKRLLIVRWRALLRLLLRTAPFLNELKDLPTPKALLAHQSSVLRKTVNLIRRCRRYFDQAFTDHAQNNNKTAMEVWDMVKQDLLWKTQSHACSRALIILYLFHPSRCTSDFYAKVMPLWMQSWSRIDRCLDFDFLWIVMFCRARRYVAPHDYDWGPMRRRLLTLGGYWLQIPVGGVSNDKSFPRAGQPRLKMFPSKLKLLFGNNSSYAQETAFVGKISKLLVFCIGKEDATMTIEQVSSSSSSHVEANISSGTNDILLFLQFVAPYFNPSNTGPWTFPLGVLLHYVTFELCHRIGVSASIKSLRSSHVKVADALCEADKGMQHVAVPENDLVAILDALLPLCQQALYSKSNQVARAGESALLYMTQIDPVHTSPRLLDFAASALDVSSVNLSHQAPAALLTLARLVQPSLRRQPSIFLERLPELLRLSLAGIDSNDEMKTMRTLGFYVSVASWVPIGDTTTSVAVLDSRRSELEDGTLTLGSNLLQDLSSLTLSSKYQKALSDLPESSLMFGSTTDDDDNNPSSEDGRNDSNITILLDQTSLSLSDWSLAFLDRIYELLRAAGEQEKMGKTSSSHGGVSAGVMQARNFSRLLKGTLIQIFSSMDEPTHKTAVRSVVQFLLDETLPFAAKDAAGLCHAVGASRAVVPSSCTNVQTSDSKKNKNNASPGLDALVPALTEDLTQHSSKTSIYRLRCLAGAVRNAGFAVLGHKQHIESALEYALVFMREDKHLFKTGCKLLRHTLASQCEAYPISSGNQPRIFEFDEHGSKKRRCIIGKSAQLHGDCVLWHVPTGEQIDFVVHLLEKFVFAPLVALGTADNNDDGGSQGEVQKKKKTSDHGFVLQQWRQNLKILRYALRGCIGLLLDMDDFSMDDDNTETSDNELDVDIELGPHERSVRMLLECASKDQQQVLMRMRGCLCEVLTSIMSLIARETADTADFDPESQRTEKNEESTEKTPFPTMIDDKAMSEADKGGQITVGSLPSNISRDAKVCKEVVEISLFLLTRRGASFRSQDAKSIWKVSKQFTIDYALAAQSGSITSALERSDVLHAGWGLYKDGENGGKNIPRRLATSRVHIFSQFIQRAASFYVPRRLRKRSPPDFNKRKLFSLKETFGDVLQNLRSLSTRGPGSALAGYEGLIDGLFALSCHPNVQVRGSAAGVVEYALTRFGWTARRRVPRLLSAISLQDETRKGQFGIPSCAQLSLQMDAQGKRKRLAEVLKGVSTITALHRTMKSILSTEGTRFSVIKALCSNEQLISLLPPEEMQKMVHYFQEIFSQFRLKLNIIPLATEKERRDHHASLLFLLNSMSPEQEKPKKPSTELDDSAGGGTNEELATTKGSRSSMHWRNRLLVGWFLMTLTQEPDLWNEDIGLTFWTICFNLIENEPGQPLQRVALGIFGRLISITRRLATSGSDDDTQRGASYGLSILQKKFGDEVFCRTFGNALIFDHKEDSSVGGGHGAQWSAGVEDILKDAGTNLAPKSMFPFQWAGRGSGNLKLPHSQLIEYVLLLVGKPIFRKTATFLLEHAKEMAVAPPSEDQRNEHCTAAEMFGGVCRACLLSSESEAERGEVCELIILPFLQDVIPKVPITLSGTYYDALRYGVHDLPPSHFHVLTDWIISKVEESLWQQGSDNEKEMVTTSESTMSDGDSPMESSDQKKESEPESDQKQNGKVLDGFAIQSKWLILTSALLNEINGDATVDAMSALPWYTSVLTSSTPPRGQVSDINRSWNAVMTRLLPCLLRAICHPYEKCRESVAGCLYRIYYCYRKLVAVSNTALNESDSDALQSVILQDPGEIVLKSMSSIETNEAFTFKEKQHALITTRTFLVYCVHLGDSQFDFPAFIIPLLPLIFEALKTSVSDGDGDATAADRMLESDVVKRYRYSVAEISCSCVVNYGSDDDITKVLTALEKVSSHSSWQVRQATAHFLRSFQGFHKFLLESNQSLMATDIVAKLLADPRQEVSTASLAALTGILASMSPSSVSEMVDKYVGIANRSVVKRKKKKTKATPKLDSNGETSKNKPNEAIVATGKTSTKKEQERLKQQQTSVFFLCAAVLARPYDTPPFVPKALTALSKHSFERSAPLGVREAVKMCCGEFKRTHMSDNWDVHKKMFTQEQLDALDDVISTPHYYA